mgnify:CR=1 FL=1
MNIKRMISSASFIKDVQPSIKKVGLFVRKHFWKIIVLTCVIDKLDDIVHYGWILPLYFFTDFLSDLCELFGVPRTRTNSIGIGCDSTPFLFKN